MMAVRCSRPLVEYPFARKFPWLTDRFGVSWQLSLQSL